MYKKSDIVDLKIFEELDEDELMDLNASGGTRNQVTHTYGFQTDFVSTTVWLIGEVAIVSVVTVMAIPLD